MKSIIATIALSFSLLSFVNNYTESLYIHSVMSIEGVNTPLSNYQGKKLFIITLPTVQNAANDSLLTSIDSLRIAQGSTLQIIATPSYEDGYTPAIKSTLQTWYRTKLNTAILITDGLYTRKTSGTQQHALFRWLTDKDKNGHMDKDVAGPRSKFFVWTDGQLLGVLAPQTKMNGVAMQSMF
jgi:glutathione peroxidase